MGGQPRPVPLGILVVAPAGVTEAGLGRVKGFPASSGRRMSLSPGCLTAPHDSTTSPLSLLDLHANTRCSLSSAWGDLSRGAATAPKTEVSTSPSSIAFTGWLKHIAPNLLSIQCPRRSMEIDPEIWHTCFMTCQPVNKRFCLFFSPGMFDFFCIFGS